jgi:GNAT superfamily N-acetyltransferase
VQILVARLLPPDFRSDLRAPGSATKLDVGRRNFVASCHEIAMSSPTIRRFEPQEWRKYRRLRLRALAESPDAFGSTLALESERPDAEWVRRLEEGTDMRCHLPLVAQFGGEPIGLAWGRIDAADREMAHLYQMWVAPEHRRYGTGRLLLDAVIAWAERTGARCLALDVTCGDTSAMRLYGRAGFTPAGRPQPLRPGSPLMKQPMRLMLRRQE